MSEPPKTLKPRQRWKLLASGFDARWLRWSITLWIVVLLVSPLASGAVMSGAVAGFCILLALYFGHVLLCRLQCPLLEWCVIILALGNLEGVLLTIPGLFVTPWLCVLVAGFAAVWILCGAVSGLAQARLLGESRAVPRVLLLLGNWFGLAGVPLLLIGMALQYGMWVAPTSFKGRGLAAWIAPMLIAGCIGTLLKIRLNARASAAARRILDAA